MNKEAPIARIKLNLHDNRAWVIIALGIGIAVRGYFLAQPMRYDESYTFLTFINKDLKDLFYYPLPNNHILHSILAKLTTFAWGPNPAAIRLTALTAGIAIIPATYKLCRALGQSGIFASIAIAICPYLILYSTNARGYTLLTLLALILAIIGISIANNPTPKKTIAFSIIAALGMLTIPSMLFPIAGIYAWIIGIMSISTIHRKSTIYTFAIHTAALTSLLTALLYIPSILASNGINSIINNRFVKAQPWGDFSNSLYSHLIQTFSDFTRDIPPTLILAILGLFIIGLGNAIKTNNRTIILMIPALTITAIALLFVKQRIPFERTWIYFIPFFIIIADSGFTQVSASISTKGQLLLKVATFGIAAFIGFSLISNRAIEQYPDTGRFPNAETIVKRLKSTMSVKDRIHIPTPADYPIHFYMRHHHVPQPQTPDKSDPSRNFKVIIHDTSSSETQYNSPHVNLLELDDSSLIELKQSN